MSTNQIEWELMLGEPWSPWSYSLYVMSLWGGERGRSREEFLPTASFPPTDAV